MTMAQLDFSRRPTFDRSPWAHILRVPLSGIAYLAFAFGGAALGYLLMPFLHLYPGSLQEKQRRCQRLTGWAFRIFHRYLNLILVMSYWPPEERIAQALQATRDEAKARGGSGAMMVVANHPTLVDTTALIASFPELLVVAKSQVARFPLLYPLMKFCGYVANSSDIGGSTAIAEALIQRLQAGDSVLLFPEFTRSPDGKRLRFQRGPFEIARRARVPIQPIAIDCGPGLLKSGLAWYQLPRRKTPYRLLELAADFTSAEADSPSGRQLAQRIQERIEARLQANEE